MRLFAVMALLIGSAVLHAAVGQQQSDSGIKHSFLALGGETYLLDDEGNPVWTYPANTRDGFVLLNGNLLLAVTKSKEFPGGAAIEMTRDGKTVWQYKGTQSEVNTVQAVGDGRFMLTEAGDKPRILEVDREGKVVVEVPIQAQTKNHHLQTRMTRKLPNGNYLVPQLLDQVVREYTPEGKIVWEAKTPADPKECWPFTAIRLKNGNTLTTCTHGKTVVEFDRNGKIVWQLSNSDLPTPLLVDPCGAQRLPNGNTVITSYGQSKPGEVKLLEVTPEKKVVWTYRDDKKHGIHEFQILDTNGTPLTGTPMK
ncbi:MAG TPA: PQQ-binding-like beta-propeller repeat protein [Tepidisphaeraceae bacterium]|nr:PQQ-binding-like beta-propeller repeat protein [Tepidisphaeraceae bacterium]